MLSEEEQEKQRRELAYWSNVSSLLVWQMVKKGIEPTTQHNKYVAEAMRKHPQYHTELNALEKIGPEIGSPYSADEKNPLLHLQLSALSRSLIEENKSARIFYKRMRRKGVSDHDIEHMVGEIFYHECHLANYLGLKGKMLSPRRIDRLFRKYSKISPVSLEEFCRKLDEEYRPWFD